MSRRALLLFALMSVIWGIPYLFIRIAVTEVTPATLVLGRTAIAAAILLPRVALGSAEQHISSSLAGLLIAGVPLVGAAIALLTGGADRFGAVGVLGMLLGIAGLVSPSRRRAGAPT